MLLLIGRWTQKKKEKGLTVCRFDENSRKIEPQAAYFPEVNVGCMIIDKEKGTLLMTDERDGLRGSDGGSGYVLTAKGSSDGAFEMISESPSMGCAPAYTCASSDGRFLIVADHGMRRNHATRIVRKPEGGFKVQVAYDQAPLALFELDDNCRIGELKDVWVEREEWSDADYRPHLHFVSNDKGGDIYFVTDPGTDSIFSFTIDAAEGRLVLLDKVSVEKGKMPRYLVFHPQLNVFYANNERDGMINIFRYDEDGMMERMGQASQIEGAANDETEPSDLKRSPDGRYLYGAVRGEDIISAMKINDDGTLTLLQNISCGGKGPRGIAVSPDGKCLVCANQQSGDVTVFSIDENGKLIFENKYETEDPGCLAFWE